jgi:hypothetical protein
MLREADFQGADLASFSGHLNNIRHFDANGKSNLARNGEYSSELTIRIIGTNDGERYRCNIKKKSFE